MDNLLIVTPAFNEESRVSEFASNILKLSSILKDHYNCTIKVVIVDDGSTDNTNQLCHKLIEQYGSIFSVLTLAGNQGYNSALCAGLTNADSWANCIITMDFDGEHPSELIPNMINKWRSGALIVNTIRQTHSLLPLFKKINSKIFYSLTRALTGLQINAGEADFRLWDANLLKQVKPYLNKSISLRLFASWLPVRKEYLNYKQHYDASRVTRFTFKKNWELAVNGLVRFSNRPLRLIKWFGVVGILFSSIYGFYVVYAYIKGLSVPGWSSIMLTVLFLGSLNLFCVGIIASYLNRLSFQNDLPRFIINENKSQR